MSWIELIGAAVATPAGDLAATVAALGGAAPAWAPAVTPATPTEPDRRTARLLGPLPARAVEIARAAARGLPTGERTGVFLATGGLRAHWDELAPAMAEQRADAVGAWARGLRRLHPLWMLRYLSNGAQAAIAHELGFLGDGATFAGAASAASAIAAASAAIEAGAVDHALIVALDDLTAIEVAVELAHRHPGSAPAIGVAAIAIAPAAARHPHPSTSAAGARISIAAVDAVDPDHAQPSTGAIAAARARLPRADRDLALSIRLGDLGAAAPLVDAAIAATCLASGAWPAALDVAAPRTVTLTAAASPGQIGVIRMEARHD